eukprot:Hpha_TRINITY_DN16149_c1_g2::TRINITY_DN16149_c1_g2_i1::g.3359::m.3359
MRILLKLNNNSNMGDDKPPVLPKRGSKGSSMHAQPRQLGIFGKTPLQEEAGDEDGSKGKDQKDAWMIELRQKEVERRQSIAAGSRPQSAAGREAERVGSDIRITSDAEEACRLSHAGAVPRRLSSLHDMVAGEVRESVLRRLSEHPPGETSPAAPASVQPVNKGKEPPAITTISSGELGASRKESPRLDSPRRMLLSGGGTRLDIKSGDAVVDAEENLKLEKSTERAEALSTRTRMHFAFSLALALAICVAGVIWVLNLDVRGAVIAGCGALQLVCVISAARLAWSQERELVKDTDMLITILPRDAVVQMHKGAKCIAATHDSLTFLFCDLVGFTKATSKVGPRELVTSLNKLFITFDNLAEQMGIMKVKTMGDAYMAVAGFGTVGDHIYDMLAWALKVMNALGELKLEHLGIDHVDVRMGVATGPAVSGVIGQIKPIYDFWGDTVNMASRMESNGVKNRVNCTKAVRDHAVQELGFKFEVLPEVFVKGKGKMDTFLLIDSAAQGDTASQVSSHSRQRASRPSVSADKPPLLPTALSGDLHELEKLQQNNEFEHDIRQVLKCVTALTEELELEKATALVVQTVRELIGCDRATLFMVDAEARELWSFHNLDAAGRRIRMPIDKGLAGWAATRAETVNIADAYADSRFNKQIDIMTGYRTRTLLCYPVMRQERVIAVIQAVNKEKGVFNDSDKLLLALLGRQAGTHLMHGTLYEQLMMSQRRAHILFEVSLDLNSKLSAGDVFESVTLGARKFMRCDKATLYLIDHARKELYSLHNQQAMSPRLLREGGKDKQEKDVNRITLPIGRSIAGHVAVIGEPINIPDAYDVEIFDRSGDEESGYTTRSVLCVPIIDPSMPSSFDSGFCLGVLEVVNKMRLDEEEDAANALKLGLSAAIVPFSKEDEEYLQSFASFVAITVRNVILYQENRRQREQGALLLKVSMISASTNTAKEMLSVVMAEIPKLLCCDACNMYLIEGDTLSFVSADGSSQGVPNKGVVAGVVNGSIQSFNGDITARQDYDAGSDGCSKTPVRNCVIAALRHDKRVLGAIQVVNKHVHAAQDSKDQISPLEAEEGSFTADDESFLAEVADVIAIHLQVHYNMKGKESPNRD